MKRLLPILLLVFSVGGMKHTILRFGCLLLMGLPWQVGAYDEGDLTNLLVTKDCQRGGGLLLNK